MSVLGPIFAFPYRLAYKIQLRALSLRNLVSGYECGRVFPAGVGPGSPSRDAANWLPPRFSLSAETRRRYGWLRIVFPDACLFRAPIWCPSGSGEYAPDSTKAEGSSIVDEPGRAEPLCARITGLNREVSEGKADVWPRPFFFLRGS